MAKVEVEVDDELLARAEELGIDVRQALALGLRGAIRTAEVVRDLDDAPLTDEEKQRLRG
ncbi:hypothetical protein ROJ8625_03372 [Roseivivax jejudonensis]|uniref:Uncharacterized protein n=1 Tax=Roseivivax jejudonensis TaxID=1529041 RepID=A0A1X6ZZ90_9RHOB|nr:hypothetical protein [Roseivivax jejudonensis]SLN65890.1 hypothetical protein ROJ8625_03372 [Roseivivax jejudonensis]